MKVGYERHGAAAGSSLEKRSIIHIFTSHNTWSRRSNYCCNLPS